MPLSELAVGAEVPHNVHVQVENIRGQFEAQKHLVRLVHLVFSATKYVHRIWCRANAWLTGWRRTSIPSSTPTHTLVRPMAFCVS